MHVTSGFICSNFTSLFCLQPLEVVISMPYDITSGEEGNVSEVCVWFDNELSVLTSDSRKMFLCIRFAQINYASVRYLCNANIITRIMKIIIIIELISYQFVTILTDAFLIQWNSTDVKERSSFFF